MFHKIRSVTPLDDFILRVEFCEGVTKTYDVKQLFDTFKVFNKLKENNLFKKVKVDKGGYAVIWNKEIDLACDDLFYDGITVESRFDGLIAARDILDRK